ncbi:hypothetical protein DK389_15000 [Methylobacterium durans]|uniref:Uncharacterized protein n=1 Tax=Methylobacterium durans TaxID=2202825 RepID=A0A2U8W625_9HYPH|nr:hypothetical protein DK389_15000 [Methylobacterium durans]
MAGDLEHAALQHDRVAWAEDATDAMLKTIVESEATGSVFSAVSDGGMLTTWREPGRTQLGPDFSCLFITSVDVDHWAELHRLGEDIYEAGGWMHWMRPSFTSSSWPQLRLTGGPGCWRVSGSTSGAPRDLHEARRTFSLGREAQLRFCRFRWEPDPRFDPRSFGYLAEE